MLAVLSNDGGFRCGFIRLITPTRTCDAAPGSDRPIIQFVYSERPIMARNKRAGINFSLLLRYCGVIFNTISSPQLYHSNKVLLH